MCISWVDCWLIWSVFLLFDLMVTGLFLVCLVEVGIGFGTCQLGYLGLDHCSFECFEILELRKWGKSDYQGEV